MARVRIKANETSPFENLVFGEYFLYKNELYLKVNENTAYCFTSGEFDYFVEDNEVVWVDEDRIVITIE